ncbi:IPT/TIG domain-containing protein [Pandoraea pnomenusa]|uniref:IPT/TIG domain-containing protein n=1 Tax=Pandoraea pnomenusa TaxID=93220 RepID=UPI0007BCD219|nr:IPT/TIG domain-containing protein [Pandoraea pnomenusa]ANC45950.1 hypothetical protein A6P55_19005 [Pandoraea pnomenusa]QDH59118.1 hypothetical protein FKQ53_07390 [Pandoraea pnomenusa]
MANITQVSPSQIDRDGGTSITINGTGFSEAVQVYFVDKNNRKTPARSFAIVDDGTITAVSPSLAETGRATANVTLGDCLASANRIDGAVRTPEQLLYNLQYVNDLYALGSGGGSMR